MKNHTVPDPVRLFWTGGWDSTFQLLRLLLIEKRPVIPYYLLDEERLSTGTEIRAMARIRQRLFEKYPHTHDLLAPMHYHGVSEIAPDPEIKAASDSLRVEMRIGGQYEWMARFCKQHALTDVQIGITLGCKVTRILRGDLVKIGTSPLLRLDSECRDARMKTVFRWFAYPISNLSKLDMLNMVKRHGWEKEMAMTWFCHRPRRNDKPCGTCPPCIMTADEGLGWRLPFCARIRCRRNKIFVAPAKQLARRIKRRLRSAV